MIDVPTAGPTAGAIGGGGARMRVLLVDDHVDSATAVARLLFALGYETRVAFDGLEGVESATIFHPDAALVDLSLPRLDGFGVAERLRAMPETREALLIALTGWSTDEVVERARGAGFDLHLVKPVTLDTLTGALARTR